MVHLSPPTIVMPLSSPISHRASAEIAASLHPTPAELESAFDDTVSLSPTRLPTPEPQVESPFQILSFNPEHRLHVKLQQLRRLPLETSPLTQSSTVWIFDGADWIEQVNPRDGAADDDIDMEDVDAFVSVDKTTDEE
jgi:hypothetical protein